MARPKAIESRSGFRYGGVSRLGAQNDFAVHDFALSAMIQWAGGWFVGGTPTLLEFLGVPAPCLSTWRT